VRWRTCHLEDLSVGSKMHCIETPKKLVCWHHKAIKIRLCDWLSRSLSAKAGFSVDTYYDYQLCKLGDQVLTFNLCRCHGQLAPFPVATCRPLTSLAAKRAKLQATILLPLETRKVACGDTVSFNPKLRHQRSVAPHSTDNRSNS